MAKKLYIRNVDGLGRLVLPAEFRKILGWYENATVRIELEGDRLVVKKESCRNIYTKFII